MLNSQTAIIKHLFAKKGCNICSQKAAAIYELGTNMDPKWSPNDAQKEPTWYVPKWYQNGPRDVPRDVPNTRLQTKTLGTEQIGHVGAHGRILSKLGAALGAILEKVDFEGGPKIVIFEAKST